MTIIHRDKVGVISSQSEVADTGETPPPPDHKIVLCGSSSIG